MLRLLIVAAALAMNAHAGEPTAAPLTSPAAAATPREAARLAFPEMNVFIFGASGSFAVANTFQMQVTAQWWLSRTEGVARWFPPLERFSYHNGGESWVPSSLAYSRALKRLYGVFLTRQGLDCRGEGIGTQILALDADGLVLRGRIDLGCHFSAPTLLLSPDGRHLFVSAQDDLPAESPAIKGTLRVLDAETLQKTREFVHTVSREELGSPAVPYLDTTLSHSAQFSPDGDRIYDEQDVITFDDAGMLHRRHVNSLETLSAAQIAQLQRFEIQKRADGLPLYGRVAPAAAVAGRMLVVIANTDVTDAALLAVDVDRGKTLAIIDLPPAWPQLLPGGKRILMEEVQHHADENGREADYKTGRLWLYDADTLARLKEFPVHSELAGRAGTHHILCVAPDASMLFYVANGDLFVVSLGDDATVRRVASGSGAATTAATCVVAPAADEDETAGTDEE